MIKTRARALRKFEWAFALVLITPLLPTATAYADAPVTAVTCNLDPNQTGAKAVCGGGATGGGGAIDTSWVPVNPTGPPCVDNGLPSWISPLYQPSTGAFAPAQCVGQAGPGGNNLRDRAKLIVKMPTPTADFQGDFLTGAPVQFSVGQQKVFTTPVPNLPGAMIDATPVDFTWDYGDGQTGDGASPPPHTYQSTTPDPTKPDNHTVSVQVSGTWHLYFHPPAADPNNGPAVQDLGTVTLNAILNPNPRAIVQVWSAQMEPTF